MSAVRDGQPDDLLVLDGVTVSFPARHGSIRAVDGVDLRVGRREIIALVGESGCGKTTLIRSIVGLETPTGGTISFAGEAVTPRSLRALRRRVQILQARRRVWV